MKKIVKIIILVLTLIIGSNVNAANYQIKELIPIDIETSIHTKNFSYKEFKYTDNTITFKGIKNLTKETKPISISVALFNSDKKNIGTMNYCGANLNGEEEISYTISDMEKYLGEDYKIKDVKYISVLGDNIKCRITGKDDYLGQTIKEIGMAKNTEIDDDSKLLIKIMMFIGGILLVLLVYKMLFTNSYNNMDGEDVRIGYEKENARLRREREEELRRNPPQPKEIKQEKSDEVIKEEKEAENEDKNGTDLHNLYK